MKQVTLRLAAIMAFALAFVSGYAQQSGCGISSPVLNNRLYEPNPCPECESCKMPENMSMEDIIANYQAKSDTAKVFGPIQKKDMTVHMNYDNYAAEAPDSNNLKALASHMDDYMDLEAMLECINVNCFFTSEALGVLNLTMLNDLIVREGGTPLSQLEYDGMIGWLSTHNIDSIVASYFCGTEGAPNSFSETNCTYDSLYCDGNPLINATGLSLREDELSYDMAELDLFSQQLQGLDLAGNFPGTNSPDLQKMVSAVSAGVDLFNGIPSMGMELMTLKSLDLSMQISVRNDGRGVRVNDFCGDLGMNWNLNAGGMITRNMKGLPDEFNGTSSGIGMGPAPTIKPCGRLAGGGFSNKPLKVIHWSWAEPNVIHIRPTIAYIPSWNMYINLDFTVEINVRYIPDTIEYFERGLGYLKAKDAGVMNGIFGIYDGFNENTLRATNAPDSIQAEFKNEFIHAIMGNKKINDERFMSPKLAKELDFLRGIYNLFENVKEFSQRLDYEQDEFYYNFDGHAGKFIINQDGHVYLMPHDNIIVTPIYSELKGREQLSSFTIQTVDGKLYEFGRSDGTGVDFMTQTNYVLPNYYTYPELDSAHIRLGPAKLQETSLPFQGAVFCYPSALEYGASYESAFTIKNSPEYTSGWHLLKVTSLLTRDSIELAYEKDTLNYYVNKSLSHEYPNFNTSGGDFISQGSPDLGHTYLNWFQNVINLLDTVATEWRFGRSSFIYTATENNEVRHRLTSITGNMGESIVFSYSDATVDIVGKKYCDSIQHYIDGNFNKGWVFSKDEVPPAPESFGCVSNKQSGPSASVDGEFGFNLGPKREKNDYPFLEFMYCNYDLWTFYIPLPYRIALKEIINHNVLTEFGSLVQIKQLFNPEYIIPQEARKFAAEKNRRFLKNIYELGRDNSMTSVMKVDYVDENKLADIPKRFSMQQDLWGYYNTNPSGSLLPRMKYRAFDGSVKEAVEAHYGFSSIDEEYDVTLGHNETADPEKCRIGFVKALELETRGRYVYEYEPNTWPGENGDEQGAGLRVRSLRIESGHVYGGTKVITYEYSEPQIINKPIRTFANPYAYSDYDFINAGQIEKMIRSTSYPMNNWETCKSNYVGYGKVREKFKGNGYTEHYFTELQFDTVTNIRHHSDLAQFIFFGKADEGYDNNYSIFRDPYVSNREYIGLEDSVRTFNETGNCVEKSVFGYYVVSGGCGEDIEEKGGRADLCTKDMLRIDQHQINWPGPFMTNKNWNAVFNFISPLLGPASATIGYIMLGFEHLHPFRRILRHTVYRLEDITPYSKKAYPRDTKSWRYYDDNSTSVVTNTNTYGDYTTIGSPFVAGNVPIFVPVEQKTEYEHGRTVITKIYYPQNSNATDLKMGTTEYDYLVDNKIFIPVKNQSTVSSVLISGSIRPLKLFGSQYLAHQLWSVKQGDWVLDGTYTDYQYGMPSEYVIACYPILYADEYDPIELVWDARRTLTSRTYEGRTEEYYYTPLRELTEKLDADGISTQYFYDERGRIEEYLALSGRQGTIYEYVLGNIPNKIITTKTYGDGTPTQTFEEHFDGFGKSIYKKRNAIKLSEAKYDAMFRQVYGFDITAGSSYMTYAASPFGELLTLEDGLGNTTSYTYRGRDAGVANSYTVTEVTDPNGGGLASYKDGLGNLLLTESAMGAETEYRYDDHLRLEVIINPEGETFIYGYNAMDKVISVSTPGRTAPQKTWYDQKYRVTAYQDANGNKFVNNYDIHNKLLGTAQVNPGTSFPGSGMMTEAVAYGHYTGGLKVLQHTFAPGKSWLKKKEEQIFRPTSTSALIKTTEALTFDNIGRVEDMKMSYPDALVYTTTDYNDANLVLSIENTYLSTALGNYSDKTETVYDAELRPWKTYFTSDLSARRLISQIKYDDRDRMITKWLDEDELQEINYEYDFSSKLTAINAPLTTECTDDEVCTYTLKMTKGVEGYEYIPDINLISFGGSLLYPVIPTIAYNPGISVGAIVLAIQAALDHFALGGKVSHHVDEATRGDVFTITNTQAGQVVLYSASTPEDVSFTLDHCCSLAPNGDGDGPQGPGPEPEGGDYDNPDLFAELIGYDGINIDRITLYNACEASAFINKYSYNLDHMVTGVANKVRKSDGTLIDNAYSESMSYDLAGNIQSMQRNAIVNFTTNAVAQIDNLAYTAGATPSKLASVTDNAATYNNRGFWTGSSSYSYDAAGNITADAGKNISVTYNPVHLPQRFRTASGDVDVHYTYGGEKIYTLDQRTQPIPPGGHLPVQRWYIGALEIENGFRKVHHHPEGRISVDSLTQDTLFEYVIRDHLGNTAVTFSDTNRSKTISPSEVFQRNYYYAFGMEIDGDWDNVSNPVRNAYLYNGKELHNWNGLNWQDYGFRYYMPEIGRFTGVDPIADQYPHVSTYNYAENDPVRYIDLWGLQRTLPRDQAAQPVVPKMSASPGSQFVYRGSQPSIGPGRFPESKPSEASPSFMQRLDELMNKIPQGTSNNYKDTPNSFVGKGIEMTSTGVDAPGQNTTPLSPGVGESYIEWNEFLNPSDAGGVLGDAADAGPFFIRLIDKTNHFLNNASGAVENLKKTESKDTTLYNEQTGSYWIYDKEELNRRGRYKEQNQQKQSEQ